MNTNMTDVPDEQRLVVGASAPDLSALADQLVTAARNEGVELTGRAGC